MATTIAIDRFPGGIPRAVRKHGRVLDPSTLEPGDLILVAQQAPGWIQRRIQIAQGQLYEWEHAQWHHAVVSGGETEICEALTSGVIAREYWDYMTGVHTLKVRRVKNAPADVRTKIAYYAATMSRTSYGFGAILPIQTTMGTSDPWKRSFFRSKGVICSQLYFEACMRAGIYLANIPSDRVSPAHLSATTGMEDVALQWLELQASPSRTPEV